MKSYVTLLPNARMRIWWQQSRGPGGLSASTTAAELQDYRRDVIRSDPMNAGGEELFFDDGRRVRAVMHRVGDRELRDGWSVVNTTLGSLEVGDPITVELGDPWERGRD